MENNFSVDTRIVAKCIKYIEDYIRKEKRGKRKLIQQAQSEGITILTDRSHLSSEQICLEKNMLNLVLDNLAEIKPLKRSEFLSLSDDAKYMEMKRLKNVAAQEEWIMNRIMKLNECRGNI
jgi:hypothetical protein